MEQKDDMLAEMRHLNEELRANIATKTDEIKLLIDRMETFKKQKDQEVARVVAR
jgi:nitrogen-specific signal transduction histidine kinase